MLKGSQGIMKKIFLVAGELSGDKLGAWYVDRLQREDNVSFYGVGGSFMEAAGVELYESYEKLNVTGVVEIIKHVRRLSCILNDLVKHILAQNFDEVVVIDFPGFNLRLIKKLKQANPGIKITYLSPPQLWIWGKWRVRKIKKYCNDVIVLYPFEVEWYKNHGVTARWIAYPFYEKLKPYFLTNSVECKNIAIIPGSRLVEIKRLLPLFINVIRQFRIVHSGMNVILPLAESIDRSLVEKFLRQEDLGGCGGDIIIVQGEAEKLKALSTCCLALTKPGTVTLELGLLSVPFVVAYKASWLTYWIAKMLVSIDCMSLTNLLLKEKLFPECIQSDCTEKKILAELELLYQSSVNKDELFLERQRKLSTLRDMLS